MADRIFLIVSGGLMDVVDNSSHFDDKKKMSLIQILQLEISMVNLGIIKKHLKVNRILECGINVKSDDAPVYAGMDWKGYKKVDFINIRNLLNRLGKINF